MASLATMTQRASFDPLGAGALLVTVLGLSVGAGALLGLPAGSAGLGAAIGAVVGIPAAVAAVILRYRGS